eukprot:COSAG02_NODE_4744_length_5031_cov_20.654096_3_plen_77_part_00
MEDPTHLYYDPAVAEEWENIKIQAAERRRQGLSKEQNSIMRDKIHESKSPDPLCHSVDCAGLTNVERHWHEQSAQL